jgi:hypothetical protein
MIAYAFIYWCLRAGTCLPVIERDTAIKLLVSLMQYVFPGGMYTDIISKCSYIDIIMSSKIHSTLGIEFYSLLFSFFKAL